MTRGKIILLTTVLLTVLCFGVFAGGTQESMSADGSDQAQPVEQDDLKIVIAALKGPSGMAVAKMVDENFQPGFNTTAEYVVLGSPLEAVTKMTSGEIDAAFLPVNTAAKLYSTGLDFKLAAVSGLGSLFMLSSDTAVSEWTDLKGKTIYLTGKGATPDYLLRYLLKEHGIDPEKDVVLNFTAQPPQIVQLLAAGKADTAFIPQPFALMAKMKTPAEIVLDPQKELMSIRGKERPFPFTAFVLSERLINERPEAAEAVASALDNSIGWVMANPEPAAEVIEEIGILGAAVAKMAIPVSGIEFIPAVESKTMVEDFLQMLLELDPVSVGGQLPDEGFYF
ncbi:MAG: ABC transporter substrate-binding protein [Spirochaetales bacterium]|uniref:ABC transporter substrate-binding protein n=1 Tax=Candidatus Thalassospirochaeta sargassi TaxID=3119039 RepID=A0AAJ1IHU6_9SPIO|nr:ABC transporter substrate-binding protein [Spirochaetales bacterium]